MVGRTVPCVRLGASSSEPSCEEQGPAVESGGGVAIDKGKGPMLRGGESGFKSQPRRGGGRLAVAWGIIEKGPCQLGVRASTKNAVQLGKGR